MDRPKGSGRLGRRGREGIAEGGDWVRARSRGGGSNSFDEDLCMSLLGSYFIPGAKDGGSAKFLFPGPFHVLGSFV